MPACPICQIPLETTRQREGIFYPCRSCQGRAMTISQARHVLGDRVAAKFLRLIKLNQLASKHPCPFCEKPMVTIHTQEPVLELESCRSCAVVWFDLPTCELLPELTLETTNSIALQSTEIVAMNRLRELKEREVAEREQEKKKKKLHRNSGNQPDEQNS